MYPFVAIKFALKINETKFIDGAVICWKLFCWLTKLVCYFRLQFKKVKELNLIKAVPLTMFCRLEQQCMSLSQKCKEKNKKLT